MTKISKLIKPDIKVIVTTDQLPFMSRLCEETPKPYRAIWHHVINEIYNGTRNIPGRMKMYNLHLDMETNLGFHDRVFIPLEIYTHYADDMRIWLERRWWIENEK